jgi:nucleoside-diphosphate-sugar epimerase
MILVTGGMGFIGVHVVKSLLDAGEDVVVTYNNSWRVPDFWEDEVGKRVTIERLDVTNPHDPTAMATKHKVDGIVHCAAPAFGTGSTPPRTTPSTCRASSTSSKQLASPASGASPTLDPPPSIKD